MLGRSTLTVSLALSVPNLALLLAVTECQCEINLGTIANAGSFICPSRAPDPPLTFIEALRKKYIEDGVEGFSTQRPIKWGGKVVEEIGFNKVQQML